MKEIEDFIKACLDERSTSALLKKVLGKNIYLTSIRSVLEKVTNKTKRQHKEKIKGM